MNPIQKPLDKSEKELPKQTSKNVDNKKINQTEGKNQKFYHKIKKKNPHIDNLREFAISHEKITKHSSHNLKY